MPDPIRALIADDERLMREQLRARLLEVWPELQIVGEARNGVEAVEMTGAHHPDVIFLDIRMPVLDGVAAARRIAELSAHDEAPDRWSGCEIVFITAYEQHAIEAFEQGAVDYVLKPAERERLHVTVDRLRRRIEQRRNGSASPAPLPLQGPAMQQLLQTLAAQLAPGSVQRLQWIQAAVGQTIQMIAIDDVLFFISDEKYTRVQTATVEALIRKPIKELVAVLDPAQFWQIHRSTVVNVRAVASVSRDLRGRQIVTIKGHPARLEVSRSYSALFKGM